MTSQGCTQGEHGAASVGLPPGEADAYLPRLAELDGAALGALGVGDTASALPQAQHVAARGLRDPAAALDSSYMEDALFPEGGVPRPLSLFVGRDRELTEVNALLRQYRLVTVTGPVGVGKTRLALEFAHRVRGLFRGGAFWVPLGGLPRSAEPLQVAAAITAAVHSAGRNHPIGRVPGGAWMAGEVLLVLDGCEHVTAGIADVARRVFADHPGVRVLLTSREPVEVAGQAHVRLDPLHADPADPWLDASPAVRLFTDRARLAAPDVVLAGHERLIAGICNALDGLPLAIELAATHCAVLSVTELLAQLVHRLDMADARPGGVLGPHTGLRAAIAWSYESLGPAERAMFRRLSLLLDGAGYLTAVALSEGLGLDRAGVWEALTSLAGKSLLTITETAPRRFGMLAAIREYGQEQLAADGDRAPAEELLVAWLKDQADELLSEPHVRAQSSDLDGAASFLLATEIARSAGDSRYPTLALATARQLSRKAEMDSSRSILQSLLAETALGPDDTARAQIGMAVICRESGDLTAAPLHARRAHEIAASGGSPLVQYQAVTALIYALGDDDAAESAALGREQLVLARALGDPDRLAATLNNLAWDLMVCGNHSEARAAIEEMLALRRGSVAPWEWHTAGAVAAVTGDTSEASLHFTAGLRSCADTSTTLDLAEGMAITAAHDGHVQRALQLLAATTAHRSHFGLPAGSWWARQTTHARSAALSNLTPATAAASEAAAGLTLQQLTQCALYFQQDYFTPGTPPGETEPNIADLAVRRFAT